MSRWPRATLAGALPGTAPLAWEGDLAARMVAGIRAWLQRRTGDARDARARRPPDAAGLAGRRQRLARILGVGRDPRRAGPLQVVAPAAALTGGAAVARGPGYRVFAVRWPVFDGVDGEGLLLQPDGRPRARVVALPDADVAPEPFAGLAPGLPRPAQLARRLVEAGCAVVVPALVDRGCEHSGIPGVRWTNMTHREFIYRAAYELGRHVLGYELETVFALLDGWGAAAVVGYGEGGRLALYAAALDERVAAAGVSGAFGPREDLWREPIDRNAFGLLRQFGDAEVAAMVAPRPLVVEASRVPRVDGPPPATAERSGAAPGRLRTPPLAAVAAEVERAARGVAGVRGAAGFVQLVQPPGGRPGSDAFARAFLRAAGARRDLAAAGPRPRWTVAPAHRPDPTARRDRFVRALVAQTQVALAAAEHCRAEYWAGADRSSAAAFARSAGRYRRALARDVIGQLPAPRGALNPRSRLIYATPTVRGYEVVLDVYGRDGDSPRRGGPSAAPRSSMDASPAEGAAAYVFSYGILLVPNDLRPRQRRPVVVCQHGLEGRPQDLADPALDHPAYHAYALRLAERGFVTFAPQNPYIGGDEYRAIQRLANPLGWSLFSVIVRQHERILQWLGSLPFVDPERIAFYGLSYGGKTAMRVPALLPSYCLSICSADYNEWIWKCASTRHRWSYMGTGEYDMPEFDLGNTCNYAELSWLIFPRPFMVERGHHDGVAPDEWVAYEYARTRRHYALLGLGDRTQIEFFDGPHTIHGQGTFAFLHRHLEWPER